MEYFTEYSCRIIREEEKMNIKQWRMVMVKEVRLVSVRFGTVRYGMARYGTAR